MAAELGFQAIVDIVGDRLREVLRFGDVQIVLWNAPTGTAHALYAFERGVRIQVPPMRPNVDGPMFKALQSKRPVIANNRAEMTAWGLRTVEGTQPSLATAMMPIFSGDRYVGAIVLENHERENAFGEAEVRLLTTVSASMGVALENARLFDETQRLLKETEQRNAELAVINSIQQGISRSLEFQAIVDLVGDTLRAVLHTQDIGIRWIDPKTNTVHPLYVYEHGVRKTLPPRPQRAVGPGATIARTLQPLIFNNPAELAAAGFPGLPGADPARSTAFVPIVGSDGMIAAMTLENFERDNAFGESEVRLLTTVAASLGVALENARLFDETQRLLKETEQRNAELAVINSIQQGMAGSLDFRGIIELVGDKLRTVFGSDNLSITWRDQQSGVAQMLYAVQHGERVHPQAGQTRSEWPVHADLVRQSPRAGQQPRGDGRLGPASTRRDGAEPGHSDGADLRRRQAPRRTHARQPRPGAPVQRGRPTLAADGGGEPWASRWRTPGCSTRPSSLLEETEQRNAELA